MAGITDEELDSYLPPPPSALPGMQRTPDVIRADHIVRDIYNRHGIEPGTPLEDAQEMILMHAQSQGLLDENRQPTHAWANPEEAAAAQEEYAARGKTPDEVQQRWDESVYLLPPQGFDYHQNYGRDASFLEGLTNAKHATAKVPTALAAWDASNNEPLFRKNWRQGTYASMGGLGNAAANAIHNPDLASGQLVNMSDVPYNFLAMQGSGEADTTGESFKTAMGEYRRRDQNRIGQPAPILDLPANASPEDRAARLRALQQETSAAAVPTAGERWKRTTGIVPPPAVRDTGDAVLATLDGTQFIPGATLVKGAMKGAGRAAATGVARDMVTDGLTSAALTAGFGQKPGRTWSQYFGFSPEEEDAVTLKSPEEVEAAQRAREQQYDRTVGNAGVSTARAAAYKRLQESGKAPISYR